MGCGPIRATSVFCSMSTPGSGVRSPRTANCWPSRWPPTTATASCVYPNAAVYAPVTGFYSLRYSSTGLERAEDGILNGSDERLFGRRLADFFTGRDPRGGNVDTTINPPDRSKPVGTSMQQELQRARCRGAVVALEPSTGKILALVSTPILRPKPARVPR